MVLKHPLTQTFFFCHLIVFCMSPSFSVSNKIMIRRHIGYLVSLNLPELPLVRRYLLIFLIVFENIDDLKGTENTITYCRRVYSYFVSVRLVWEIFSEEINIEALLLSYKNIFY